MQRILANVSSAEWSGHREQEMNPDGDSDAEHYYPSIPAGMSARFSEPVSKTKKSIVLAQSDTVVFNNTHTHRGRKESFQLIALRQ